MGPLEQQDIRGGRALVGSRSAAERIEAGEQLVLSTIDPQVRHVPRHPNQHESRLVSLCNQNVMFILPDAPALRGRSPLPLCAICGRHSSPIADGAA